MQVNSHVRNLEPKENFPMEAERRVRFVLRRFARELAQVRVVIEDVNGPRGGVDHRCRLFVEPKGGRAFSVVAKGENAGGALEGALVKAKRLYQRSRKLDRQLFSYRLRRAFRGGLIHV